jgi:glycosyltransferase involved in cell wall biosynthesis
LKECGDKFIICFIGRHNSIKGYDLLKDAATILLEKYPDIAIVVAGVPGPMEPVSHPRWIECGWMSNPEQLIAASNVFVLPNRSTFFDLVLLEAMSIGTPIIASRTGGNVTVAAMSDGVRLFDGLDGFVREIERMKSLSRTERASLAEANQKAYSGNFSVDHFASNYLQAVGAISGTV